MAAQARVSIPRSLQLQFRLRHRWHAGFAAEPHHHHICPRSTSRSTSALAPARTTLKYSSIAPHLQPVPFSLQSQAVNRLYPRVQSRYYTDNMASALQKDTLSPGDGQNYPQPGDTVSMHYTGWLYDPSKADNKGEQFDSSINRGEFTVPIGVKRVIQGWDEGVVQMSVGEKARLTIPGHMAYGPRGFPGKIPPNATLIFDVQLLRISK